MYQPNTKKYSDFKTNTSYRGESMEALIRRMKHTKEPIKIGTGMLYTNRADKVVAEYDPRADKMENLLDATIEINAAKAHKLTKKTKAKDGQIDLTKDNKQNSGEPGSTSATDSTKS